MKNIHILPTDKPSFLFKLFSQEDELLLGKSIIELDIRDKNLLVLPQNIYITSDEEIKEGDWYASFIVDEKTKWETTKLDCVVKADLNKTNEYLVEPFSKYCKKIILTTDFKLAPDVQKIDDEFLEWFVKNPSCEEVEVKPLLSNNGRALFGYKIIIPTEEPKQQRMYSEEEVLKLLISCKERFGGSDLYDYVDDSKVIKWFEQIKKK